MQDRCCLYAVQVNLVVTSPLKRALDTAVTIADYQAMDGSPKPVLQTMEELTDRDWGSSQGRLAQEVRHYSLAPRQYQPL